MIAAAAAELLRKDCGIRATDRIIGMVARVAELKDFRTFAEAAAQILAIRSDVVFVVVGDYSQPQQKTHYDLVRSWIAELGIESRFIFTGHRDDAARLLAAHGYFRALHPFRGLRPGCRRVDVSGHSCSGNRYRRRL